MFLPASDDNAGLDGLAVGTWWGGPGSFVRLHEGIHPPPLEAVHQGCAAQVRLPLYLERQLRV